MDFSKLNLEFANMQNTITKYNSLITEIKNRINLEKESYKILVISLKNETSFLENIIKEEDTNVQGSGNIKSV